MTSNINKWGGGGLRQRGTKKKQVEYIKIQVIIPILEYQGKTWTWLKIVSLINMSRYPVKNDSNDCQTCQKTELIYIFLGRVT